MQIDVYLIEHHNRPSPNSYFPGFLRVNSTGICKISTFSIYSDFIRHTHSAGGAKQESRQVLQSLAILLCCRALIKKKNSFRSLCIHPKHIV